MLNLELINDEIQKLEQCDETTMNQVKHLAYLYTVRNNFLKEMPVDYSGEGVRMNATMRDYGNGQYGGEWHAENAGARNGYGNQGRNGYRNQRSNGNQMNHMNNAGRRNARANNGDSDFMNAVSGANLQEVIMIFDDYMSKLRRTKPSEYDNIMSQIYDLHG